MTNIVKIADFVKHFYAIFGKFSTDFVASNFENVQKIRCPEDFSKEIKADFQKKCLELIPELTNIPKTLDFLKQFYAKFIKFSEDFVDLRN